MSKKWLNKNLLGFGLTSLFNDFSYEMVTPILPLFIQQFIGSKNTPLIVGIITGIADAFASILKIYSGILTDRIKNYKNFLIFGYAITPLFVSLIGTAKTVWQIFLYRIIAWSGKGIREPMRDTWLTQIVESQHYGKAFGFLRACDSIGSILGPAVTFFAIKFLPLKTIFLLSFIPGIFSVVCLIFLTEEKKEKINNDSIKMISLTWIGQIKNLPKKFKFYVFTEFIFGSSNFHKLLIIYRAQEVLLGQTSSSIISTGWSILLYVLFNAIRSISEYSIGSLSDYINRKNLLLIFGYLFHLIMIIIMLFSPTNIFVWTLIFLIAGISNGTGSTLSKAYSATLLPVNQRGTGFGLLEMIIGISILIANIAIGSLWSLVNPEISFIYAAVMNFIAMILLMLL